MLRVWRAVLISWDDLLRMGLWFIGVGFGHGFVHGFGFELE